MCGCVCMCVCVCIHTYARAQFAETWMGWMQGEWRDEDPGKSWVVQGCWASCQKWSLLKGSCWQWLEHSDTKRGFLSRNKAETSHLAQGRKADGTNSVFVLMLRPLGLVTVLLISFRPSVLGFKAWCWATIEVKWIAGWQRELWDKELSPIESRAICERGDWGQIYLENKAFELGLT